MPARKNRPDKYKGKPAQSFRFAGAFNFPQPEEEKPTTSIENTSLEAVATRLGKPEEMQIKDWTEWMQILGPHRL